MIITLLVVVVIVAVIVVFVVLNNKNENFIVSEPITEISSDNYPTLGDIAGNNFTIVISNFYFKKLLNTAVLNVTIDWSSKGLASGPIYLSDFFIIPKFISSGDFHSNAIVMASPGFPSSYGIINHSNNNKFDKLYFLDKYTGYDVTAEDCGNDGQLIIELIYYI